MKITTMVEKKTTNQIIEDAKRNGFIPVTYKTKIGLEYIKTTTCKKCGKDMIIFSSHNRKTMHTVFACTCGYRVGFKNGGIKKNQNNITIDKTKRCPCGNLLPKERKKYCYTCRPKTKSTKEVANINV